MIHVHQLWKRYGARPVLQGVTLEIAEGERVALVGPNGSGKTTLIRCLLGLLSGEGTVRVGGHDPLHDHAAAAAHIAYVPQRAPTLPVPVSEIVGFWSRQRLEAPERLVEAAASLGLDVGSVWDRRFPELSGGMQQKLLAATALASRCPLLLLDEPTANLDPPARNAFFEALSTRNPRPTVLLSSHRLEELRHLVDRVVVLTDGRIAYDDDLSRFLANPTLAAAAGVELGVSLTH
jgi:ABC-2 type transport system ATP-binding protein